MRFAIHGASQPKIQHLDPSAIAFQPDVARLDVPMDQPALVGRGQSLRHFAADAQDVGRRQPAFALEPVVQRLSFEQRHGQKGRAAFLPDLEDRHDVVVLDGGHDPRFAQEALLDGRAGRQRGQDYLEGDQALELNVLGFKDQTHAAPAQHSQDAVQPQTADLAWALCGGEKVIGVYGHARRGQDRRLGWDRLHLRGRGRLRRGEGDLRDRRRPILLRLGVAFNQALDDRIPWFVPGRGVGASVADQRVVFLKLLQGLQAVAALRQVPLHSLSVRLGELAEHEPLEVRDFRASGLRNHGERSRRKFPRRRGRPLPEYAPRREP